MNKRGVVITKNRVYTDSGNFPSVFFPKKFTTPPWKTVIHTWNTIHFFPATGAPSELHVYIRYVMKTCTWEHLLRHTNANRHNTGINIYTKSNTG